MMLKRFCCCAATIIVSTFVGWHSASASERLKLSVASAQAEPAQGQAHQPEIAVRLTDESRAAAAAFSTENQGRFISIAIGGIEVSRPKLLTPITGGVIMIWVSDGAETSASHLANGSETLDRFRWTPENAAKASTRPCREQYERIAACRPT